MTKQVSIKIFAFFALLAFFAFSSFAQTAAPTPTPKSPKIDDENEVIKVDSRLVVVPVSVTDAAGQPVTNLTAKDFFVREEGKTQQIEQIGTAEKVPLEIALLFDISASTDAMFQFEQETAAHFLQEVMRPEDRATIFTVGAQANIVQTRAVAENAAIAVKNIQPTKQQTAFYDSVRAAANYLQKVAPEGGRRKVIVVISDGDDTNSEGVLTAIFAAERKIVDNNLSNKELRDIRSKARDTAKIKEQAKVLQALQNADAVFYSINPGGSSYQLNQMSQFGQSNLQKFADATGGTAFLPKFQPTTLKEPVLNAQNTRINQEMLVKIFQQLQNELQAQYLVQFYSDADFQPGRYVKLDVGLNNPNRARVRARQGYFVK